MVGWSGGLSAVEIYNPVTDMWTKGSDMPTGRNGLSTSVVNGRYMLLVVLIILDLVSQQ